MLARGGFDHAARPLHAVLPVVRDPRLPEDRAAEAARPLLPVVIPGVVRIRGIRRRREGMRRGAQPDDRAARLHVAVDVRHRGVRQRAEARRDHHEIGVRKPFEPGEIRAHVGIDLPRRGIDREEHVAREAVPLGEDPRELRHCFLGAILLVARDQHDGAPDAGPAFSGDGEPRIRRRTRRVGETQDGQQDDEERSNEDGGHARLRGHA